MSLTGEVYNIICFSTMKQYISVSALRSPFVIRKTAHCPQMVLRKRGMSGDTEPATKYTNCENANPFNTSFAWVKAKGFT